MGANYVTGFYKVYNLIGEIEIDRIIKQIISQLQTQIYAMYHDSI